METSFSEIFSKLDYTVITDMLFAVIPALICITLHELSHGYVAYRLGDNTAKDAGRLTLNPIKHIDIFGLIMMVVFKFGWAKPVPVNMFNFKNPKRDMAITALAGPLSNIIIGSVFLFVFGIVYIPCMTSTSQLAEAVIETVYVTAYLSFALAVFNIVPVPPLDGSKVLFSLLSDKAYLKLMYFERYGMIALLLLVSTGILGTPLQNATEFLMDKFSFFMQWGYDLYSKLAL